MFKKIFIIFVIPFLFYGCGYSPLYSNVNNQNINIEILESTGDQEINNHMITNLNKYSNDKSDTFLVSFNTDYSILDNSKDTEGTISSYKLFAAATFQIQKGSFNKTITIKEDIIIKNLNDNFEKKNYVKSIKRNFSNSIVNKLIFQLSSIQ